jgi:hypothetical protein
LNIDEFITTGTCRSPNLVNYLAPKELEVGILKPSSSEECLKFSLKSKCLKALQTKMSEEPS